MSFVLCTLFCRYVFVYVLAADEGIEENIEKTDDRDYVGDKIAYVVGKHILEERQNSTTADKCHKNTAGSRGIFAESFSCKVEDGTPHYTGHQTAEEHNDHADRQFDTFECNNPCFGEEHYAEQHHDSRSGNRSKHCFAAYLAADSTAEETTAHHHQPIETDYSTCNSRTYQRVVGHIEIGGIRNTYLNAHIEENSNGSEYEVAE